MSDSYISQLQASKKSAAFDQFVKELDRAGQCPVRFTNDIMGGKWKPVIFNLILHDVNRFGEMIHLIDDISKKVLTTQLRQLETDGIIERTVYDQKPGKVTYGFTNKGRSLIPVIDLMCKWGLVNALE
jgi:DNA-binding HxlR family transcriptional regulator